MSGPARVLRPGPALAAVLLAAVAGCSSVDRHIIVGSVPEDYRVTHPIAIDESIRSMDVPVGLNTAYLSDAVRANIRGFAQGYAASGSDLIAVVVPRGSPNERVAKAVGYQVADTLVAAGVRRSAIDFRSYTAGPGENAAPVRIAYAAITAKAAPCGPWTDQSARTGENRHYGAYGCAAQNNLAAIVSNPLDLLYPRGTTPPDAERRSTVLDNYRNGDPTQGDYSREAGGAVAQGVGD